MSKYIRTKDRLCELTGAFAFCDGNKHDILNNIKLFEIVQSPHYMRSDEIINEADTIEELCDERVLTRYFDETKYMHHEILPETQWDMMAKSVAARLANGITDVNYYGAIWTDKGLIYVAQMNENKELVLL